MRSRDINNCPVRICKFTHCYHHEENNCSDTPARDDSCTSSMEISNTEGRGKQFMPQSSSCCFIFCTDFLADEPAQYLSQKQSGWETNWRCCFVQCVSQSSRSIIFALRHGNAYRWQAPLNIQATFQELVEECVRTKWKCNWRSQICNTIAFQ